LDQHLAKTTQDSSKPEEKHEGNGKVSEPPQTLAAKEEQEKQENVLDFVNEIKAQAEKVAWSQAGFIYEPTSGLYYDTKSTYYYSPDHDLYYNGNDGNWYRHNPRTDEFIFHSGTEASQAAKKVSLVYFRVHLDQTTSMIPGSVAAFTRFPFIRFSKLENQKSPHSCFRCVERLTVV
jgi:hypothetical protein